jgi:hypothetical protein
MGVQPKCCAQNPRYGEHINRRRQFLEPRGLGVKASGSGMHDA